MAECKRHYYKTMCGDGSGRRAGKYRGVRFESAIRGQPLKLRKKSASTTKKTTKKAGKRPAVKAKVRAGTVGRSKGRGCAR